MISRNTSRRDFLFVACASISWGTTGIANQTIYAHSITNGLSLAFLRLAIATPLFMLASWQLVGRSFWHIKYRDLGVMLLMGALQALSQAGYSAAIPYAGVTISTLIAICVAPVLVACSSVFITGERLTLVTFVALISALSGTVLLVMARSQPGAGSVSSTGILLAFLSACGYAGFILCGRLLVGSYHPLCISTVAFTTGALLLLCLATSTHLVITYPAWEWIILLYLGCVPTALAYGLFQVGIRSLSATVTSIVTLCEPLTAALLAWILFGEQLNLYGLLGAGLLLGAMTMLLFSSKQ
jgi:DME family drug/metabolite transporter